MAGSILISNGSAIGFNSTGLKLVIDMTKEELMRTNNRIAKSAFVSYETDCMPFVDLEDMRQSDLLDFFRATSSAFQKWEKENTDVNFLEWKNLIEALREDVRISKSIADRQK